MKKIIFALLILATIYAFNVWGQAPGLEQEVLAVNDQVSAEPEQASFTLGGFLIILSIAAGYAARRIYAFRNSYED